MINISFDLHIGKGGLMIEWHDILHTEPDDEQLKQLERDMALHMKQQISKFITDKVSQVSGYAGYCSADKGISQEFKKNIMKQLDIQEIEDDDQDRSSGQTRG